jgi:hypothetical protein
MLSALETAAESSLKNVAIEGVQKNWYDYDILTT